VGERSRGNSPLHIYILADKAQAVVGDQRSSSRPDYAQDLEAVADADQLAALIGELLHRRSFTGLNFPPAGAQVVPIGEPARKDDAVEPADISLLMPYTRPAASGHRARHSTRT